MRRLVLLTSVVFAAHAPAQVIFSDNFETGTLLTSENPPGKWPTLNGASGAPWQTIEASDGGAFSGSYGMVLSDFFDGGTGLMTGKHLRYDFTTTFGNVYTRARFKVTRDAGSGGPYAVQMHGNIFNGTIAEFGFEGPGNEIGLNCGDATTFVKCPAKQGLTMNEWHELNLAMEGLGTATGICSLVLDGTPVCVAQVDWTTVGAVAILAGTGAMNSTWDGTLSLDDVVITSGTPPPSALVLRGAPRGDAGGCMPFQVSVIDGVDGGLRAPLSPTFASFDAGVSLLVFEDTSCATASDAGVRLALSTSNRDLGLIFTSGDGPLTIGANDVSGDLRPGFAPFDLNNPAIDAGVDSGVLDSGVADGGASDAGDGGSIVDAGADAGTTQISVRSAYDVGCGCGAAGAAPLMFLFAAFAAFALRRREGVTR
jgi:MYXO-CTERM domain-containing protein